MPARHCSGPVLTLLALAASLAGCGLATDVDTGLITADALEARLGHGVVFLAMRTTPSAHMDALYEGPVLEDGSGCLRHASPDPATVVWPEGWSYEADGETILILNDDGALVGRIGEDFRLGGGEVDTLSDAMGFTGADRDLAASHCPGKYWVAAPQ